MLFLRLFVLVPSRSGVSWFVHFFLHWRRVVVVMVEGLLIRWTPAIPEDCTILGKKVARHSLVLHIHL